MTDGDAPMLTPEQTALVERFAAELGCDPTRVLTVALRELAGRLHRFREHGEVTLGYLNARETHVDWRPNPTGFVEYLVEQYQAGEPVPPPAVLRGHGAISGRHRLHAARALASTKLLVYKVTPYPKGDPRHLRMAPPPMRGDDPVRAALIARRRGADVGGALAANRRIATRTAIRLRVAELRRELRGLSR